MLALDSERAHALDQAIEAPQVAPPQAEVEAAEQLSLEGELPAVEGGTVAPGKTASEQAFGDQAASTPLLDAGMHHPDDYQLACVAAGTPARWDDKYNKGHTGARQWTQPYDGPDEMVFHLKPGSSGSQAVKDFLAGPTIVDYRVMDVAMQMDELRDELGDLVFDSLFGSSDPDQDAAIGPGQRLQLNADMYTIPFYEQMLAIADEVELAKNSEPEEPVIAAGLEETRQPTEAEGVAPEAIAEELGIHRDQELA